MTITPKRNRYKPSSLKKSRTSKTISRSRTLDDYFSCLSDNPSTPSPNKTKVKSRTIDEFLTPPTSASSSIASFHTPPSSFSDRDDTSVSEFQTPSSSLSHSTPPTSLLSTISEEEETSAEFPTPPSHQSPSFCSSPSPLFKKKKQQTQLYLDFGQSNFGKRTICQICGMLYVHGLEEDRIHHARICKEYLHGVSFSGWKNERVNQTFCNGKERIIAIRNSDPVHHRNKVLRVKAIVDREIGFIPQSNSPLDNKTAFLYISNQRVVGFCTAELISQAYRLLTDGSRSDISSKVLLGIHQIWCHASHRQQGISTRLVDAARDKMIFGLRVSLKEVAFSSPTGDGIRFAKKYLGVEDILVYVC